MFLLTIENAQNEKIQLTQNNRYSIVSVDGLDPPNALIYSSVIATNDGAAFNSSRVSTRNIVITIAINGDTEKNRIDLYRVLKVKQFCKIRYRNGTRDVAIEGYVETMKADFFALKQKMQISIICLQPYFKEAHETYTDISQTLGKFEFPFSIESDGIEFSTIDKSIKSTVFNHGDVTTGVIIELTATGTVTNPKIFNADNRGQLGLNLTMSAGDLVRINTNTGEKAITLYREGSTANIINCLMKNSVWFQIFPGDNIFTYECETGNEFFNMRFIFSNMYEGV